MDSLLASAGVAADAATGTAVVPVQRPEIADELIEGDVIVYVDPSALLDSPFQPRTTYNEAKLIDGAETMKPPHGRVHQPLVARDISDEARPLFAGVDTLRTLELVFGHRRKRMAIIAGLRTVPVIVRRMTDEQVKYAQLIENMQREDVGPFDEAETFQKLIREHGETADTIAARLGGPDRRSFVYGRLKLLAASPEVRTAVIEGKIGSEIAIMIARCGPAELQQRALQAMTASSIDKEDGGKKSLQEARDLMARMFTLDVRQALFKIDDESLVPGAGACKACPKLSGNDPVFLDLTKDRKNRHGWPEKGSDTLCTDIACWDRKKAAHLAKLAEDLRGKGKVVVDGAKAKAVLKEGSYGQIEVKGAYVALDKVRDQLKKAKLKTLAGLPVVTACVTLIQNPANGRLIEVIEKKVLRDAGIDPDKKPAQQNQQQELEKKYRKAETLTARYRALLDGVRAAAATRPRELADLEVVIRAALRNIRAPSQEQLIAELWHRKDIEALKKDLHTLAWADLAALLLDIALTQDVTIQYYDLDKRPQALLETATRWGVPLEQPSAPASTPSPAALAPTDSREADANASALAEDMAAADAAAAKAAATPKPAARAQAKAPPLKYRNALTGETWSGRGLQPKWLKVAIEGGKKLSDFEIQAGSAGKDDKGAGSAGVSSSLTPAKAGGVAAKGKTEGGAA